MLLLLLLSLFKIKVPPEKVLECVCLGSCILPTGSPLKDFWFGKSGGSQMLTKKQLILKIILGLWLLFFFPSALLHNW